MTETTENRLASLVIAAEIEEVIEELVDIEEHILAGKPIPKAQKYRFRVNKKPCTSDTEEITREQILEKAGLVPVNRYRLSEKKRDQPPVEIPAGTTVHLRKHGIERFIAQECEVTDGRGTGRRDFALSDDDRTFLDSIGAHWEAIKEGNGLWIVVYGVSLPSGYTVTTADVAIQISAGYPTAELDMAYFHPFLALSSGRPIPRSEAVQKLDGRDWQRWSRHRTGTTVWLVGVDNLETHFAYIQQWLTRETSR